MKGLPKKSKGREAIEKRRSGAKPVPLVVLQLPMVSQKLHAHTGGGRWGKVDAVRDFRGIAMTLGRLEIKKQGFIDGPAWVEYEFRCKSVARDRANLVQSCKPYIDGVVDSGILEGDRWNQLDIWRVVYVPVKSERDEAVILRFAHQAIEGLVSLVEAVAENNLAAIDTQRHRE